MSERNDGGPAFPYPSEYWGNGQPGMSLRDWFAGMAISGLLADPGMKPEDAVEIAFQAADAMLKARES